MKNLKRISMAIVLLVSIVSYGQHKMNHGGSHDKGDMKMKMMQSNLQFESENVAASYQHYLLIKDALVKSDPNEAQKSAAMLALELKNINNAVAAERAATKLAASTDLDIQRRSFASLSDAMIPMVKDNIISGRIYKDFCPMAMDGGAFWLSSDKDISNPYYGNKMLRCGSVEEIIE